MIILFLLGSCRTSQDLLTTKTGVLTTETRLDLNQAGSCPNTKDKSEWHNCSETVFGTVTGDKIKTVKFSRNFLYLDGKPHGAFSHYDSDSNETCEGTFFRGKREGLVSCYTGQTKKLVSQKMYSNGEIVKEINLEEKKRDLLLNSLKEQCSDIGFKNDTEAHANCVLDLMKINSQSKSSSGTGLSAQSKELLDLKIKREQQYQTDRKIEGMKELLEYGKSLTQ
jgi:hypothetical protein